jgi:hypothetical protein
MRGGLKRESVFIIAWHVALTMYWMDEFSDYSFCVRRYHSMRF